MSIMLSQFTIAMNNPYSALVEQEHDPSSTAKSTFTATSINLPTGLTRAMSDDDLDRMSTSSWSVVNSAYGSDTEDNDYDTDEIYTDGSAHHLVPLTISSLTDGFTAISKTMTATSTNSSLAQPNIWVVKVTKRRQKQYMRKPRVSTATAPSLEDVLEGSDLDEDPYMPMTEHELSKSTKAVQLKNDRLAVAHDVDLIKTLKHLTRDSEVPRPYKIPTAYRSKGVKARTRSHD
ncbi:hypothetical protein BG011_006422 [Mortierella polycephala]|uniref:Uncharacterized protein n=1 Tax=Mortierella polycephala TaxID=41804 RepID=A0A9P6PUM9_9FUNG|nr:hypothetical protein BG011_006422 [Mortierella polycephala]